MEGEFRVFDFGKYGQALAWVRARESVKVVAIEASSITGGIRTAKASADLYERVLKALRRR